MVGALGVDTTAVGDFEIATAADGTNSGYAVLVVGGVPTSYQIDLTTGVAATAGAVTLLDANELVRDTAIAPPAHGACAGAGDVFALTESNKLVSFNSGVAAEGVHERGAHRQASGENIVGIDVRPADATLYALGSTGHLYTVDPATGALTLKVDAGGRSSVTITAPYTGLTGTKFVVRLQPGQSGRSDCA